MKKMRLLLFALVGVLVGGSAFAQDQYERKSISYVDVLLVGSGEVGAMSSQHLDVLLSSVKEWVEMERFDYNPLPEKLIREFVLRARAEVRKKGKIDENDIAKLIETTLVPEIQKILDTEMDVRAAEAMDESDRQSFLATKAKEVGYTLEEIETVLNSAYVYIPFANGFSEEAKADKQDKSKKNYTTTLNGGIIWYHVDAAGEKPVVSLLEKKTTTSMGFGDRNKAFKSMAKNFGRNLQVATQDIDAFKLKGTIEESGEYYGFTLGKKEGVKLDKVFFVGEYMAGGTVAEPNFSRDGWMRVKNVGDNRDGNIDLSYGYKVSGSDWGRGMTVIEHPRLGIDIAVRAGVQSMAIEEGLLDIYFGEFKLEDYSGMTPTVELAAQMNIANLTGVNQLFFNVGGSFSASPEIDAATTLDTGISSVTATSYGVFAGLTKKFYFGRTIVSGEARVAYQAFQIKQNIDYLFSSYDLTVRNSSVGGQLNLGAEYAFTPDLHIGGVVGLRGFAQTDFWDMKFEDDTTEYFSGEAPQFGNADRPTINHTGIFAGLYVHYTPPSLPFDPFDFISAAISGDTE